MNLLKWLSPIILSGHWNIPTFIICLCFILCLYRVKVLQKFLCPLKTPCSLRLLLKCTVETDCWPTVLLSFVRGAQAEENLLFLFFCKSVVALCYYLKNTSQCCQSTGKLVSTSLFLNLYYSLNVCVLSKSILKPNPQCDHLEAETVRRWLVQKDWALINGISAFIKEILERVHVLPVAPWETQETISGGKKKNGFKTSSGDKEAFASNLCFTLFKCAKAFIARNTEEEGHETTDKEIVQVLHSQGHFQLLLTLMESKNFTTPPPGTRICIFLSDNYTSFLTEALVFCPCT